jgi:hypothetical protein
MLHPRTCQICSILMPLVPLPAIHISSISRHRNSSPRVQDSLSSSLALPNTSIPPLSTPLSLILLNQREVKFRWKIRLSFNLLCLPLCLLYKLRSRSTRSLSPHLLPAPETSRLRNLRCCHYHILLLHKRTNIFQYWGWPCLPLLGPRLYLWLQSQSKEKGPSCRSYLVRKIILPGLIIMRRPNLTTTRTQWLSLCREIRSILPPNGCAETI